MISARDLLPSLSLGSGSRAQWTGIRGISFFKMQFAIWCILMHFGDKINFYGFIFTQ